MDTILFFVYLAAYLVLLAWGIRLAGKHGWRSSSNVLLLVIAGLVYDNTVIATGRFVGEGALLEGLNAARFWLHAFLTPLLVVFAWNTLVRAGVGWARTQAAAIATAILTGGLILLEMFTEVIGLSLMAVREYGVLSYSSTGSAGGPPLMVLIVAAALIFAAVFVWRRQGWPWYLMGSVVMVVGSAVPIPIESGAVTNAFELLLLISLVAAKQHQDRVEARSTASGLAHGFRTSRGTR